MFEIREMHVEDLAAVARLQDRCYAPELFESHEVLQQRLMLYPQSCWVACYQDKLWGYLFSYPSLRGKINPLGAEFAQLSSADCLYLHDLAVSRDARGYGVATALVEKAVAYAYELDLSQLALVAVQNSASFWQQQGFAIEPTLSSEAEQALGTYELQDACYMVRHLAPTL